MPKLLVTYDTVLTIWKDAMLYLHLAHLMLYRWNVKLSINKFEIENVDRGMCQPKGDKELKSEWTWPYLWNTWRKVDLPESSSCHSNCKHVTSVKFQWTRVEKDNGAIRWPQSHLGAVDWHLHIITISTSAPKKTIYFHGIATSNLTFHEKINAPRAEGKGDTWRTPNPAHDPWDIGFGLESLPV